MLNSFCSTHNEMFETMDEKQETMVTTFMDTSLKYLHGASEDGLYIMVVRCLEVCICVCVHVCVRVHVRVWCGVGGMCSQKTFFNRSRATYQDTSSLKL